PRPAGPGRPRFRSSKVERIRRRTTIARRVVGSDRFRYDGGRRPLMKGSRFSGFLVLFLLTAIAGATVSGCIIGGHAHRSVRPGDLDFRLGPFTYLVEGKLVGLVVGAEAARYREKEKYVPFADGIAN